MPDTAASAPTPRSWRDRLRVEYRKRVVTPAGAELVVRARRKIDATGTDPLAVPLPLFIIVPWAALRELRNHTTDEHRWIVEVFPRWEPGKARRLAETSKYEAMALADAEEANLAQPD